MAENQNFESQPLAGIHDEIADLERKLEEKKRIAAETGFLPEEQEKKVFKEVVKEHIEEKRARILQDLEQAKVKDVRAQENAIHMKEMAEEKQLEELINIAITKSPIDAIHTAQNLHNPKLVDMLHDYLTDRAYEHLVEARKLRTQL